MPFNHIIILPDTYLCFCQNISLFSIDKQPIKNINKNMHRYDAYGLKNKNLSTDANSFLFSFLDCLASWSTDHTVLLMWINFLSWKLHSSCAFLDLAIQWCHLHNPVLENWNIGSLSDILSFCHPLLVFFSFPFLPSLGFLFLFSLSRGVVRGVIHVLECSI